MDLRSQQLFDDNSDKILAEAAEKFGTTPDKLKRLGSFESLVYEYCNSGRDLILKLTHSIHRTADEVLGELEWVNYLAEGGVTVSPAVPSSDGNLIELVELDDSYFIVYAFEKAQGELSTPETRDSALVKQWGRTLGRMHRLTRDFVPSDKAYRRRQWYEDEYMVFDSMIPAIQEKVRQKCHAQVARLRTLPVDNDSFGLIHSDIHHGNFFVQNGDLTVFDFDDSHYGWFAFDIAMPLFYTLADVTVGYGNTEHARKYMTDFMSGYREEYQLDSLWMGYIPDFLKLREMDLYSILAAEKMEHMSPWCLRLLEGRRERIENDVPFIDMDFSGF